MNTVNSEYEDEHYGGFGNMSSPYKPWYTGLSAMIGVLGVTGNLLVMLVIFKVQSLRNTTKILVFNQSLIDLSTSVSFSMYNLLPKIEHAEDNVLHKLLCMFWTSGYFHWAFAISSSVNLILMTLHRYFAIIHPIRHYTGFTFRIARRCTLIPWVVGITIELHWALVNVLDEYQHCTVHWPISGLQNVAGVLVVVVIYFSVMIVNAFVYVSIALKLLHRPAFHSGANKSDRFSGAFRSVLITFVGISTAYAVCWTLNQVLYFGFNLGFHVDMSSDLYHFSVILAFSNSYINTFVYAYGLPEFRKICRDMLRCKKPSCIRNGSQISRERGNGVNSSSQNTWF
ncbi:somatostatin receptor type 5-like [Anneissia japonica]|uniref:somatostatin receptor type 5-like n=1 Tax=Anneissia japonica TaxID=1529436 RepID=UPI00142582A2|nr:somatostatin receptor type 5-like [Anneissia japonica]XP_033123476.1 somatostatin receptor type 5-like [Anneissia japonica]